jgi:hypothetical protein
MASVGETPTHDFVYTDAATPRGRRFVKGLLVLFLGIGSDLPPTHTGSGLPGPERHIEPYAMEIYTDLFESMMDCWDRIGFRHGLVYTAAMMALGLGFCLNLLSIVDLLWAFGVLENPYRGDGTLHPHHYVYGLLCGGFIANTVLARIKFSADQQRLQLMAEMQTPYIAMPRISLLRSPGPAYVMGSAVLFLTTLTLSLLVRG